MKTKDKTICSIHKNKKRFKFVKNNNTCRKTLLFLILSTLCLCLYSYVTYLILYTYILTYFANLIYN